MFLLHNIFEFIEKEICVGIT